MVCLCLYGILRLISVIHFLSPSSGMQPSIAALIKKGAVMYCGAYFTEQEVHCFFSLTFEDTHRHWICFIVTYLRVCVPVLPYVSDFQNREDWTEYSVKTFNPCNFLFRFIKNQLSAWSRYFVLLRRRNTVYNSDAKTKQVHKTIRIITE